MSFLTPGDAPFRDGGGKSATADNNFGGNREYSQTADSKDYTKRTGAAPNKKENPEDTTKDVDDMTDPQARKREFSYQEDKMDAQRNNESDFIRESDPDSRPPEDTDAFTPDSSDPNFNVKTRRSKLKWQFGDGQYEGEVH